MKTKLLLLALLGSLHLVGQSEPLVYQEPGAEKIVSQRHVYRTVGDTALYFDLYLPSRLKTGEKVPVVVFVNGVGAMDMPEWRAYQDWARLVANRGLAAVTFQSRPEPYRAGQPNRAAMADFETLLGYLQQNEVNLGVDAARIGIFCSSANVKTALPVVLTPERQNLRALVIYYGSTDGAVLTRQDIPILMARSGQDNAQQNEDMAGFFAQALRLDAQAEFINYPSGLHGFDISNNTDESRAIIRRTLDFFVANLQKPAGPVAFVLTPGNLGEMIVARQRSEEGLDLYRKTLEQHRTYLAEHPNGSPFISPYFGVVREETLNQIGYKLLRANRIDESIAVFETNRGAWPDSPNAYDALGDAFEAKGDATEAIRNAELALEKLETAQGLQPQWAAAIRRSATDKLQRLKKN